MITSPASVVQCKRVSWLHTETVAKMVKEIAGDADLRGSDGARVNEERGHSAGTADAIRRRSSSCRRIRHYPLRPTCRSLWQILRATPSDERSIWWGSQS